VIREVLPYALRCLDQYNIVITFVDVGSRNGVLELRDLAEFVEAYGFEPNPEEYEKLIAGKTDLFLLGGISSPSYRRLSYFPYAVGNFCGKQEFYVTPGPGACGVLEPDLERLREIVWKGRAYKKNFAEDIFANYGKICVETQTLDAVASKNSITHIDYLKIDVEGSEHEVLDGSRALLPRTGVIKVETCFIPFRKRQKLFSHVDLLLREFDFDLLRYEIHPAQVGYKERNSPVMDVPAGYPDPYGQALSGDAVYVNRSITDPDRAFAQAVVLLEKNYIDEALHVLRTKTTVQDPHFINLLATERMYDSIGRHLQGIAYRFVDRSLGILGRLAHFVRR
jgi:FkbM family methyltransferase